MGTILSTVTAGGAAVGVGLLAYHLGVQWNNYQVNRLESKVIDDASTLLSSLQSCSRNTDSVTRNSTSISQHSAFSPMTIGDKTKVTFKNRIIKAATYEALCDNSGIPLPGLADFHVKMADGGCGMTIVAYAAVSIAGRSFPAQLVCRRESLNMLKKVTTGIHNHGSLACIQLTHAGYFADRSLAPAPLLSSSPRHEQMSAQSIFNPAAFRFCRVMTADDYDRLLRNFVEAAEVAVEAGFDCLEVHCGHGYLLSQFISPHLNPGTTLQERLKYPLKVGNYQAFAFISVSSYSMLCSTN